MNFYKWDAHYRVFIALALAAICFVFTNGHLSTPASILLTWSSFALTVIVLDWLIILTCHPSEIRKIISLEDSSRTLLFLFIIVAAVVSLGAIIFLLKSPKGASDADTTGHVLLSIGAVIVSWWLVHTIFTMRYAHLYYAIEEGKRKVKGGLMFPEEDEPDYLDFVYFSFVLGTTFQVSDVEISSRKIRRLALAHGLISFAFNTVILALTINVVSGLVSSN